MEYKKVETISIKDHSEMDEAWVQDRIADDPSILGLGDLILKDKERRQPHAGRLDLLLQDSESNQRYEVEVQLGRTDESHIIRTIEYWDIERKRYPQYDHTAVIVAEDITSRFLNVINLFNGVIPLVAIQMKALRLEGHVSLLFTTVLSQIELGLVDEDEEVQEVVDRAYWEQRASAETMRMTDELHELLKSIDAELDLKHNKFYIGLAKSGRTNNFIIIKPQKNNVKLLLRHERSDSLSAGGRVAF